LRIGECSWLVPIIEFLVEKQEMLARSMITQNRGGRICTSRMGGTVRFVYKHVMKGAFIEGALSSASSQLKAPHPNQRIVVFDSSSVSCFCTWLHSLYPTNAPDTRITRLPPNDVYKHRHPLAWTASISVILPLTARTGIRTMAQACRYTLWTVEYGLIMTNSRVETLRVASRRLKCGEVSDLTLLRSTLGSSYRFSGCDDHSGHGSHVAGTATGANVRAETH
jgi:hypothetical protein